MRARTARTPRARVPAVSALTLLLAVLLLATGQSPAAAAVVWSVAGPGSVTGASTTVPRGATPGVTKSTNVMTPRLFTIEWGTAYVGGRAATAYLIRRTTGGTTSTMTETTCDDGAVDGWTGVHLPSSTVATTHSCTDTVPSTLLGATYTWTVEPIYRKWTGAASVGTSGTA